MPYYIYDIHPGSRINRLYGAFTDYHGAEICERDTQKGIDSGGDRFVMMIYAENQTHAAQRIKQIRRERALR